MARVLLILAVVVFGVQVVLALFGVAHPTWDLIALGLAFGFGSFLVPNG